MKRTKRMLALVLAMMMAFSMLAIPAAAHGDEDEGIMPLYDIIPCPSPNCNGYRTKTQEHGTLYRGETCSNIPDEKHFHEVTGIFEIVRCDGECRYHVMTIKSIERNLCCGK